MAKRARSGLAVTRLYTDLVGARAPRPHPRRALRRIRYKASPTQSVKNIIVSVLAAAALLAGADDAEAQELSRTRGFMVGIRGNASAIQSDENGGSEAERGLGLGAQLGFGVTSNITVFLRADAAAMSYEADDSQDDGEYAMAIVDLGGRYSVGTSAQQLRPYVELALSGTAIADELLIEGQTYEVTYSGGALMIGGGIEYFVSRNSALDVGLQLGKGQLTTVTIDGEEVEEDVDATDFTTVRLSVGFTFHP